MGGRPKKKCETNEAGWVERYTAQHDREDVGDDRDTERCICLLNVANIRAEGWCLTKTWRRKVGYRRWTVGVCLHRNDSRVYVCVE